jgi:hypothetical protein
MLSALPTKRAARGGVLDLLKAAVRTLHTDFSR